MWYVTYLHATDMAEVAHSRRLKLTALQSRDAIELLSEKWRIAILHLLQEGPLRTHELQSAIDAVSPKMLTQTLRGMERDGLVKRTVHPVAPPHVEYELTMMGRSVIKPLRAVCHWARAHVAERDMARTRFDLAADARISTASQKISKRLP